VPVEVAGPAGVAEAEEAAAAVAADDGKWLLVISYRFSVISYR
jgi:hypothetical protein